MPSHQNGTTKHPSPHQLSIAFIKIFWIPLFMQTLFWPPFFKPPPYVHKKTPQSHSFTGHECLKGNVWMRERNIWRGRRVPGKTRQDFPLRIVNHPPPPMVCGRPSCKTAEILQVCPSILWALRFNNVCYRNVADFSCKFSCILQVCRRFLKPPGCSGPSPGGLTCCR